MRWLSGLLHPRRSDRRRELGAEREQRVCLGRDQLVGIGESFGHALVNVAKLNDQIPAPGESELA
jgi:hypothetical protein